MSDHDERELDERIETLPRSIRPPRDLWTGIAARISSRAAPSPAVHRHERRRTSLLAGAAIMCAAASVAAVLIGHARERRLAPSAAGVSSKANVAAPTSERSESDAPKRREEETYRAAVRALEQSFAERRGYLSHEAVGRIELSLAVLDGAIAATQRALAAEPDSLVLLAQLFDEYQQKVDVLTDVLDLTART